MNRPEKTFPEKAREHWTPERTKKVTAGKKYPILPLEGAELLRALGLLNSDASMSADAVRKYVQINHMVLLFEPFFLELSKRFSLVRVLDAGCGSSFLTFLLAWCFQNRWKTNAHILGVDSNPKLVEKSRATAGQLGLHQTLKFDCADLKNFDWNTSYERMFAGEVKRPNAVIALHACDTATDVALGIGIAQKADFLGVAPCCQSELAQKWATLAGQNYTGPFAPVFANPNLRRDIAAHITDTMRMLLVRGAGYEVTTTEFVPSQHSPKNRLLTAARRGNFHTESQKEYAALKASLGDTGIFLESLT
jgi:SAM-dependent methyltransferase